MNPFKIMIWIFQKFGCYINCLNPNSCKYGRQIINKKHFSGHLGINGLWGTQHEKGKEYALYANGFSHICSCFLCLVFLMFLVS